MAYLKGLAQHLLEGWGRGVGGRKRDRQTEKHTNLTTDEAQCNKIRKKTVAVSNADQEGAHTGKRN